MEKEKKRLEVIKRRQERELSQLLQYEVTRQQLQVKKPLSLHQRMYILQLLLHRTRAPVCQLRLLQEGLLACSYHVVQRHIPRHSPSRDRDGTMLLYIQPVFSKMVLKSLAGLVAQHVDFAG